MIGIELDDGEQASLAGGDGVTEGGGGGVVDERAGAEARLLGGARQREPIEVIVAVGADDHRAADRTIERGL